MKEVVIYGCGSIRKLAYDELKEKCGMLFFANKISEFIDIFFGG